MKSRLLLYGFTIVVIAGLVFWIARNSYWEEVSVPMPLRGEAISNPFYAAQRLAESLGARTEWRKTMGEMPPTGAVMLLQHWNWDLIAPRRQQLERWVENGGRLVLDNTFYIEDDGPFQRWSGLSNRYLCRGDPKKCSSSAVSQSDESDEFEDDAAPAKPDDYCRELQASAPAPGQADVTHYSVCTIRPFFTLHSQHDTPWALSYGNQVDAIRVPVGRGSVTMVNAAPFGNRDLVRADHGLLFAAATQLHRGDLVVFMSEEKYASLLELIWKYGAPSVVLALLLLGAALWRNGARFGPPIAALDGARRSLVEQIVGTGRFTLRFGGGKALHAASVRALHEAAAKRLPGYARMGTEDRVAQMARMTQTDPQALAETMNYSGARGARDLKNAVELLERVRRRLLARNGSGDTLHAG
jgi:hypothetical protein